MNENHQEVRTREDPFAINFSQKQRTKQETTNAEEYTQINRGIVDGSPEYIQI
jgi:hypothetical protein